MSLKDRIKIILSEQCLKQKELASAIKITESYVSNLLNGNRKSISEPLASLIEEVYGYSAEWIISGNGEKYIVHNDEIKLSPIKRRVLADIENMTDDEIKAVMAFIRTINSIKDEFFDIPIQ